MIRNKMQSITTFILLFLVIFATINYLYLQKIESKTKPKRALDQLVYFKGSMQGKSLKAAFFGTSHSEHGIVTPCIPKSYNFGFGGSSTYNTYYKVKMISENDINVENIVFEIDYITFNDIMVKDFELKSLYEFKQPKKTLGSKLKLNAQEVKSVWDDGSIKGIQESYFPSIGNGMDFSFLFSDQSGYGSYTESTFGYLPVDRSINLVKHPKPDPKDYRWLVDSKGPIGKESLDYFLRSIKLAKEKKMNVYFIKTPNTQHMIELYDQLGFDTEDFYDLLFFQIDNAIGGNYTVIDHRFIFPKKYEYFMDYEHLNDKGAKIFTKKIYEDLGSKAWEDGESKTAGQTLSNCAIISSSQ